MTTDPESPKTAEDGKPRFTKSHGRIAVRPSRKPTALIQDRQMLYRPR